MHWPFVSRRERLRRQAADWVARLNGPDAARHRARFDAWYSASPDHAAAFERLSRLFDAAGAARHTAPAPLVEGRRGSARYRVWGFGMAAACAALILFLLLAPARAPVDDARIQVADLEAPAARGRSVALLDGSHVHLSPGSRLRTAFDRRERRMRLLSGTGEFEVARESRPFIVTVDGADVIARGTRFVVSLAGGRTTVALIEGAIDVTYRAPEEPAGGRKVARLRPGERLVLDAGTSGARTTQTGRPGAAAGAAGMLAFDETPLREAMARFARVGGPVIRIGDPSLEELRLTGAFRADDPRGFARSAAAALGLEVEAMPDGALVLRRGRGLPRR